MPDFGGTQFETDDDIRSALIGLTKPVPVVPIPPPMAIPIPAVYAPPPAAPKAPVAAAIPAPANRSLPPGMKSFRPTVRPPMAYLTVCDDGSADGEILRLRDATFTIGRTDGDLIIPHDPLISGRHLEIARRQIDGKHKWVFTDLESSNGLFVRVSRVQLTDRSEFLVGQGRYRFEMPEAEPASAPPSDTGSTMGYAEAAPFVAVPRLIEMIPGRAGTETPLLRAEYWIGSDAACTIARPDDPYCHPKHCRIFRQPNGAWMAEHPKTLNGLWIRLPSVTAADTVQFQIGEQRFKFRVDIGKSE